MHGLAHNLIHKKCAELWRGAGFIHGKAHGIACLNFAQHKNSHINQGCSVRPCALLTILSTECVQNCINRFVACPGFPPREHAELLPHFSAWKKTPLKSRHLHGVNRLAHNLIHTLCVELRWRWKTAVWKCNRTWKTPLSDLCHIFMHGNKNDINQCTWRVSLRLHTILSTDCVQNFDRLFTADCAPAATFLRIDLISFKINDLIEFLGFAHNLVHSKCAELLNA
ncbi:hypothetical protein P9875_08395 [Janthinobacterium rivuli]|uniref:Uncharacterized protein n=1 Tax=Janthinobacterium rivuli TaxID=2751478 RepID=A0ABY8I9M7_9BURK|nr:hypothetical protein [Janthinobacterium rivuli]WFR81174.1 hypothetical protein P9875_08395 [Janthinobacterium rivuli]